MQRQRVDGHKFENEFERTFNSRRYVLRLHTPSSGYSGITQPADYLVFGKSTAFIELKETSKDRFALTTLEQLDEIIRFNKAKLEKKIKVPVGYYLVVHFIAKQKIKVITSWHICQLIKAKKQLYWNSTIGIDFDNLKQMEENFVL